ncbi:MAG: glycosyltransferase family 2 protein [Bacteroidetes bacterium]|nr:glycosyltransferase family 2 protein [Bacteroidota bacterium]
MDNLLSVIIINYKTPDLLLRCINSIKLPKSIPNEIIVIDNASNDDSKQIVTNQFPNIIWIQNPINEGFGRANNIGVSIAKGEYLLLLNSDMILQENTILCCLQEVKKHPQIGVLGCKLLNEDGSFQKSMFSVASFRKLIDQNLIFNYFLPLKKEKEDAVMGSFMMIPKKVFQEVGGFDPDFFMYSEELELCHRISKAGYKIYYFDKATAIHKHGGSISNKSWGNKQRYLSNALLFYKVRGLFGYLLYHKLFIGNAVTNFFAMWLLDKEYRKSFYKEQKYYFSNFVYYLKIPFLYSAEFKSQMQLFV